MQTAILTLIIPIISMIITCAFLALWWNDRKQLPVLAFAACFASLALGVAINIWIIEHANAAGVVAYHLVSMAGLLCLMWGVAKRADVKAPLRFSAISVILVSGVLWYTIEAGQPDAMRLTQNTNSAMITALIAVCLWYGTKRNWADHALVWVLVLLAGFGFIRPTLTILVTSAPGADSSGAMILQAVHVLTIATLLTLIALCLITSVVFGAMEKEREKATIDLLTGLANRAAFEEQATQALESAQKDGVLVSLLVGDIDNFKSVNDTWGHSAGDKVIACFGSLISSRIRPQDFAGRVGGEEFCILVWNCPQASAVSLGNRLRLGFSSSQIGGFADNETFTASFGVAQWRPGESYAETFRRADEALYGAKRAGRNRVQTAAKPSNSSSAEGSALDQGDAFYDLDDHRDTGKIVPFEKIKAGKPFG